MRNQTTTTIATYAVLGIAGIGSFSLPDELGVQRSAASSLSQSGDTIYLDGVIRDFPSSHPDFNAKASAGNGHYAGNLDFALGGDDLPAFTGTGFKVNSQWTDRDSKNIAPHLYVTPGQVRLGSAPGIDKDAFFDTWDSSKGAYGPTNKGAAPSYTTNSKMPGLTAPTNLGPSSGNVLYKLAVTLSSDVHCDNFDTAKLTVLSISGHRTVLVEGNFTLGQQTQILILPNSSLTLYVQGAVNINQTSQVNMNTWDPALCRIYNLGTSTVSINQGNQVCAVIVSPKAPMHLHQNDHFYGTFTGKGLQMDQTTGFHSDRRPLRDSCGNEIKDSPGGAGVNSTGGITAASYFSHWFSDTMGVNISGAHSIELSLAADGAYEYVTKAFYPIDGRMLGNEGMAHNHYFTFSASTTFTHHACDQRFFEFQGADDAWLFINGQMVLDLGGIAPMTSQRITMDRLGLEDGKVYRLDFFYAQRQANVATFALRTNLDLARRTIPYTVSAGTD